MKKKNKILLLCLIIDIIITATICSALETDGNVYYDFEDRTWSWDTLYNNPAWDFETEENGNKYINLRYNGHANRDRAYFDAIVYKADASQKIIQTYGILMLIEAQKQHLFLRIR